MLQVGIQENREDAEEQQRHPGDQHELGHDLTASPPNPAMHSRRHRYFFCFLTHPGFQA
jgi:hypothetical protein